MTNFSNPSFSSRYPADTDTLIAITKYDRVILNPKVTANNPMMTGLSKGLVSRKVMVGPKPALALSNPLKMGMVEHEQNGVIDPNKPAKI